MAERRPRNLQGLLNFCLEQTQSEDAQEPSQFQQMTPEQQAWLSEAISGLATDPVKEMMLAVQIVLTSEDINTREEALEDVMDFCQDVDLAMNLQKAGGWGWIQQLLRSDAPGIRRRAAELVAAMTQNNEVCQQGALDAGLIPVLLTITDKEDEEEVVRVKSLGALSCAIREFVASQKVFMANQGLSVLIRAMQRPDERLQTKAAFLLASLCSQVPAEPAPAPAAPVIPVAQGPPPFIPTHEFQPILEGQSIPAGLHVRMNMTTGEREAKIMDRAPSDASNTQLALQTPGAGPSAPGRGASGSQEGEGAEAAAAAPTWEEKMESGDNSHSAKAEDIAFALVQMGCVEQMVGMLRDNDHSPWQEHLMRGLHSLLTACPQPTIAECLRPELQLRELLEERMRLLEGREEYREELESASAIYQKCFCGGNDREPDR